MAREGEQSRQDVENENQNSEMMNERDSIEPMQEEIGEEVIEDPTEDYLVELTIGEDVLQRAFNGHINYEELDAQECYFPGFTQTEESEPLVRYQKRRHSSSTDIVATPPEYIATSSNRNGSVKPPSLEATPTMKTLDESKISVMSLVTHIKNIAACYNIFFFV